MNSHRLQTALAQYAALRVLLYPARVIRRLGLRYRDGIQEELLDNLGELLCEDPVVHVKAFQGRFAASRESALFRRLVRDREYESELVATCVQHLDPTRDAIDVGANIGLYTVLLARSLRGRRVLAIEPTPGALGRLRTNVALNAVGDAAVVFAGAASDRTGVVRINTIPGREEYSSGGLMVHPSIAGEAFVSVEVPARTIDTLAADHALDPGFVKIDVEGMEHVVLNGMRGVLERNRPVILSELSDPLLRRNGSSSAAVISFIRGYGYEVTDPLDRRLRPGQRPFGDILCVPVG